MAQLPRQHDELPTMVSLVSHEVAEKMHKIRREVLPGGWRNRAVTRQAEPDQFDHPAAAAFESALQFRGPNRAPIDAPWNRNTMTLAYHLDPRTPGVVNVRREHSNRAPR